MTLSDEEASEAAPFQIESHPYLKAMSASSVIAIICIVPYDEGAWKYDLDRRSDRRNLDHVAVSGLS